ncbi:MAG TPA: CYCXC family (seleno)protein [Pyrinomonadaceae bacterium]|nr:CYCXC family (seleno)protein [Pyrinomonadaceae bacterium]
MNKPWLIIAGIAILGVAAIVMVNSKSTPQPQPQAPQSEHLTSHPPIETPASTAKTVPAHFEHAPNRSSLGPTLQPEQFTGLVRDAYRAVREIPQTIAQMPCYCHCDRGMGHKSLYSCFEDDHASHCAVCVNEALLALKLEREQKLTPAQIRDRIVQQFGQ